MASEDLSRHAAALCDTARDAAAVLPPPPPSHSLVTAGGADGGVGDPPFIARPTQNGWTADEGAVGPAASVESGARYCGATDRGTVEPSALIGASNPNCDTANYVHGDTSQCSVALGTRRLANTGGAAPLQAPVRGHGVCDLEVPLYGGCSYLAAHRSSADLRRTRPQRARASRQQEEAPARATSDAISRLVSGR